MTFPSWAGGLLYRLVRVACLKPVLTLALGVALAVVSVWYAVVTLTFATSVADLLPQGQTYMQRFNEYQQLFGEIDDLIIVVAAPSLPEAKVYASRFARELRLRNVPLQRLTYRIDPEHFERQSLLYLDTQKLREIRARIFDHQDFLEGFASRPTLDQFFDGLATEVAGSFVAGFFDLGLEDPAGASGNDLRLIEDLVAQVSARVDRSQPYVSPWSALFSTDTDDGAGYFLSEDRSLLFILAVPSSEEGSFAADTATIDGVRQTIRSLHPDFPHVQVGVTGRAALGNDEMVAAFRDSETATVVASALILGLLLVAFRSIGKSFLMLGVLGVSLCWSIGFSALAIGHLSLFSVMFISIIIGIGIDYGIYFLFRYEEELALGRTLRRALEISATRSGPGVLLAAVMAAGTFYVLVLTDFRGVQELGIIAGTAVLLSWLAMMTLFPAALVLVDRRQVGHERPGLPGEVAAERLRMPAIERLAAAPRLVLGLAAVLTLLAAWGLRGVGFDYNLLDLQAKGTESVIWEKRILATSGRSGFAALATASSLDELRSKDAAFSKLATVFEVDSLLPLIPSDQEQKRRIIGDFAPIVAPVRIARPEPMDVPRLVASLQTLTHRLGIAKNEAPVGDTKRRLAELVTALERLIGKLRQGDPGAVKASLATLQEQLYGDFVRSIRRLQDSLAPTAVGLAQVPEELRSRYYSDRGLFLLEIHPAVNIWTREGAEKFVTDLRGVDPAVTGTPIITFEAIRLMELAYRHGTIYAVALVALLTALALRRMRETLLALVPLGLGLVWTAGLMYFFSLEFTLGNVFGLPLIVGASSEYGLNMVLRSVEGRSHGGPLIARSTVLAVLINGLTNIVGFGSLMLAAHRGIFGLGLLLTLGTAVSLIASLAVLPVLLHMHQPRASRTRPAAVDTAA